MLKASMDFLDKILIFSASPVHSLSDSFECRIGDNGAATLPNLFALEMDAKKLFEDFKGKEQEKYIGEVSGLFAGNAITEMPMLPGEIRGIEALSIRMETRLNMERSEIVLYIEGDIVYIHVNEVVKFKEAIEKVSSKKLEKAVGERSTVILMEAVRNGRNT